jgi:hypothetical protein
VTAEALAVAAACGLDATTAEALYRPVASATRGVWRVSGGARTAVVKVLQPVAGEGAWAADLDPASPYFWRGEADFYASGLPDALRDALRVPALYGAVDLPGGAVGLCIEDVAAAHLPSPWPVETYVRVAVASARAARVDASTLGGGWLAAYVARHGGDADLTLLDGVPEAFCHNDFSVKNVFPAADPPVAIDWAFAGTGPLGSDVGGLALESALDFHLPVADVAEVTAATHDAFAAEVDAGEDTARRSLCASAAVRFAWIRRAVRTAAAERPETLNGRPLDEALPVWTACLPHLDALEDEVRAR